MRNESFKDLIFYEIYPTSFYDANDDGIGDLKGIETKLDYIKDLGCNAIWINPFFVSPFKDGGYDISNFFDIDPKFGNMKDFESLIKKANKLEIKIVVDCVAGHSSEEAIEFIQSGKEKRNQYTDLYIWNSNVWDLEPNCRLVSGRHPRNGNYYVNFFSFQPAFNFGFNKIEYPSWQMSYKDKRTFVAREYVVSIMKFWLNKGVFGFRVDMADSLVKNDNDKSATIEVWNYIFKKVKKDYPNAFFVSEWSNPSQSFKAGFDCDFVLDHWDNFYHRLVRSNKYTRGSSFLKGGTSNFLINDLKRRYDESIKNPGYFGIISGNHDTTRIANFLSGNSLKMFYMFMFSMPGIPFLYYGDEIEMKTAKIPNKDGGYQRTGSRTPMMWVDNKSAGFSKASITNLYLPINKDKDTYVLKKEKDKESIYNFIKKLIQIRKTYPTLTSNKMSVSIKNRLLKLSRGECILYLNCSKKKILLKENVVFSMGKGNMLLPNQGAIVCKNNI